MALRFKMTSPQSTSTEQAIGWYARQRSGPLSEEDAARFEGWLKDDPTHVAAWKEVERLWERVGAVRDDPAILALRETARQRLKSSRSLSRKWGIAAGLAAGIILSVAAWWSVKGSIFSGVNRSGLRVREASTEVGERSILMLPDGSKVTLNTASAVRAEYSEHQRRVTLIRGEAFFNVAKDAARPFIVSARSREVQAVGTAFDVRLQSRELRIALVEGQVRVFSSVSPTGANSTEAPSPVTLVAGTALVVSNDGGQRIETEDELHATSWLSGKLIFEDERLADIVAEMNQYSQQKLEIANPSLGERKVSGVFEATDGTSLAKALQDYGIAQVTEHSATTIVLDVPSASDSPHKTVSP